MRGTLVVGLIALVLLLAAVIPSPYSVEGPGPVVNILGTTSADGKQVPVLSIPHERSYATSGSLNLLTVSIQGSPEHPEGWLQLLPALLDPAKRIAPRSEFYSEGEEDEDRDRVNAALMDSSQTQAAAAALRLLGRDVDEQLLVTDLIEGGPAEGKLEAGDEVTSIDGTELSGYAQLKKLVAGAGASTALTVGYVRDGKAGKVEIVPRVLKGEEHPAIGIVLGVKYRLPTTVDVKLGDIGGPSAGMMFALAIYDRLTPGKLTGGKTISGTGTVDGNGDVGAIGGLEQKMWAASRADSDLFIMPADNCSDLPDSIPGDMPVSVVSTLEQARKAATSFASDGEDWPSAVAQCSASK